MQVKPNSAFLAELKNKLPEFFDSEGNFDLDKFKGQLEEHNINELRDGYQLNFIGKDYARRQAGERPSTVIVPDEEQNNGEGKDSKNLFFTGDNLEVLRHLQASYANKVDMIYIDPPYNTGNDDFVYPDKFEYSDEKLKEMFGMDDEHVERLKSIQGKSSHSAWLTFMYPRLELAKKLIRDKGTIFISIDDNEEANLKNVCDEIFGEINFIGNIIWNSRKSVSNDAIISLNHNSTLVYSKNPVVFNEYKNEFKLKMSSQGFTNPDNDPRGPWKADPFDSPGIRPNLTYKIINPNTGVEYLPPKGRCWRTGPRDYEKMLADNRIVFGKNGKSRPQFKRFLFEAENKGQTPKSIWDDVDTATDGTKQIQELFKAKVFSTLKPTGFIKKILSLGTNQNAMVLDFFAGSSTTADAVMQLNAEDGGNRKFIMVQLPEKTYTTNSDGTEVPTKGGKTAYEAGFKSIDEISRERIRRAAAKIKADNDLTLPKDFDGSFKHYWVVSPTKQTLDYIEEFDPNNTNLFTDMVSSFSSKGLDVAGDATGEEIILTTWLAKDGYSFDADIKKIDFAGYEASLVEDSRLYIINNGWSSESTEALLNKIGTHQITVQTIALFGYSFNVAELRELENGLNQLDVRINLLKRY